MEFLTPNSLFMMERTMSSLWQRQTAILENISHVETPGYKTKYVAFEDTLRSRILASVDASRSQMRQAVAATTGQVYETSDESSRLDGNNVNITQQGVELSRNQFQLQYTIAAITGDLAALRSAIRGQ